MLTSALSMLSYNSAKVTLKFASCVISLVNEVTTSVAADFVHNAPYSRTPSALLNDNSDRQAVIDVVVIAP